MTQPIEPQSPAAPVPVDTSPARSSDWRSPRSTAVVVAVPFVIPLVVFAVLNVAVPALANSRNSPSLRAFALGHVFGQLAWLAVWLVLGSRRWPARLLLAFAAGESLFGFFVVGLGIGENGRNIFRALPILPLAMLSTAFPLILVRWVMGWQIAYSGGASDAASASARRFTIRDVFAVTAVVAASLALARAGLIWWLGADSDASGLVVVLSLVFSGLSLFLACPCVWSSLCARSTVLVSTIALAYAALLGTLGGMGCFLFVRLARQGSRGPSQSEVIWTFICFVGAVVLTLHGGLVLARKCGYSLLRAPRRRHLEATELG